MSNLRDYCVSQLDSAFQRLNLQAVRLSDNTYLSDRELVIVYRAGRVYIHLYELHPESNVPMFLLVILLRFRGSTDLTQSTILVIGDDLATFTVPQQELPFCFDHMQAHKPVNGRCKHWSFGDRAGLYFPELENWVIQRLGQLAEWGWTRA